MRDLLTSRGEARVSLVRGSGGVFEISVDGTVGFSKRATGRFPSDDELKSLLTAGG